MDFKKDYSFLKESEFFKHFATNIAYDIASYETKDSDIERGEIKVYDEKHWLGKEKIEWNYEKVNDDFFIKYRRIEATPNWFQELYKQTERKYDEITRLRKLFSKGEG